MHTGRVADIADHNIHTSDNLGIHASTIKRFANLRLSKTSKTYKISFSF